MKNTQIESSSLLFSHNRRRKRHNRGKRKDINPKLNKGSQINQRISTEKLQPFKIFWKFKSHTKMEIRQIRRFTLILILVFAFSCSTASQFKSIIHQADRITNFHLSENDLSGTDLNSNQRLLSKRQTADSIFDEPLQSESRGATELLTKSADGNAFGTAEETPQVGHLRANGQSRQSNMLGLDAKLSNNQQVQKLHIVRLFAPDAVQNGTQNVTLDCMFKFDPKLDQRLTIKWFFDDELEPIYQWIPELNKRVYSDKYEHLIDKSYQVTEDVDWMLQAYKWLISTEQENSINSADNDKEAINESDSHNDDEATNLASATDGSEAIEGPGDHDGLSGTISRKLLANRLNRLAKLGSDHSRHLLRSLRQMLAMDNEQFAKFRALRLVQPPLEMSGRYTCSISSLESDDLQSTRLIVFEPPTSFTLNVNRTATPNQYNLTCRASSSFPRPALALYRYRPGQPEPSPIGGRELGQQVGHARRPHLAATQLKQEPLSGVQTQLTVNTAVNKPIDQLSLSTPSSVELLGRKQSDDNEPRSSGSRISHPLTEINLDDEPSNGDLGADSTAQIEARSSVAVAPYEIVAWAIVDESSLSANLVTQFECLLTIEGTNFEQRQTLALQKGWHVNSQALIARSTLVGLMSVLASILCLLVAIVSALLVFKLMRQHANKSSRVHQSVGPKLNKNGTHRQSLTGRATSDESCEVDTTTTCSPSSESSTTISGGGAGNSNLIDTIPEQTLSTQRLNNGSGTSYDNQQVGARLGSNRMRSSDNRATNNGVQYSSYSTDKAKSAMTTPINQSEGIYRVPDSLKQAYQHQQSSFVGGNGNKLRFNNFRPIESNEEILPASNGLSWPASSTFTPTGSSYNSARMNNYGQNNLYPGHSSKGKITNNLQAQNPSGLGAFSDQPKTLLRSSDDQQRPMQATISVNGKQLYC